MFIRIFRLGFTAIALAGSGACLSGADGAWISLAPLADPRQEVAVAELNGRIYAIGGLPRTDRVQQYDPISDSWKFVAPLPIAVDHAAAASVGGKLYVMGGNTHSGPTSALFEYDDALDRWARKAPMPTARSALAAGVIEGKIYAAGGSGASERELEVYDPAADAWEQRAPMPTGRNHLAAGVIAGKLHVAGGRFGGNLRLAALEVYDPATGAWIPRAPMPTGRSGHAGAVVAGRFYTFGGEGNPASAIGIFSETEGYDPQADRWTALEPMKTPRHGVGAAAVGNRIYVPAGATRQGGGSQTGINEAFVVQSERLVFAHFAAGGGVGGELIVANPSETADAVATLELRDQRNAPLETNLDGILRSKATFTVPRAGSAALSIVGSGAPLRVGWATVRADLPLAGLIFLDGGVSGLDSSRPSKRLFFPVQRDPFAGVNSAVAVANTTGETVLVDLVLRSSTGSEISRRQWTLPPGGQIAELLERIFPDAGIATFQFRGTVTVSSTGEVAVLALLFRGDSFTTLPVTGC